MNNTFEMRDDIDESQMSTDFNNHWFGEPSKPTTGSPPPPVNAMIQVIGSTANIADYLARKKVTLVLLKGLIQISPAL